MNECAFALYEQAYSLLDNMTPIPADCGELCGRKCCHGDENDGMLLFPGEEEFIGKRRFLTYKAEPFRDGQAFMAVCKGRCNRLWRPLSCRIYPFAPRYDGTTLTVTPDPRVIRYCPLLLPEAEEFIDPAFLNAVQKAFTLLLAIEGLPAFLQQYTQMLTEYERFTAKK